MTYKPKVLETAAGGTGLSSAGTSGNVLTSNGTNWVSSTPSGQLVLISSQTASNSASIIFTSGISGYDLYYLSFYDVTLATNAQSLLLQYSTDSGSTYISTNYSAQATFSSGTGGASGNVSTPAGALLVLSNDNTLPSYPIVGYATLYGLLSTSYQKMTISLCNSLAAGAVIQETICTNNSSTSVVNALKILSSSGNISTGKFKLYGILN